MFGGVWLIIVGLMEFFQGLSAVLDDEFFVVGVEYVYKFDLTTWGWIHLIGGILVAIAGGYLLTGSVIARTVGVIMAFISALIGFAWVPWYPLWGLAMVTASVFVIWALTAHGRDVAEYQ